MKLTCIPVIHKSKVVPGYYISENGDLYSTKRNVLSKLKVQPGDKHNPYPKYRITVDGKSTSVMAHRLVCETFHNKPIPDILTEEEWNKIPQKISRKLFKYFTTIVDYQVNHIDHNVNNFRSTNLEWVTPAQNQQKYQQFKMNRENNE